MTVGIPGTGLGGLFYFVLVAAMPFHEAWRTVRGRSSLSRWRHVGFHASMAFSMLAVMWIEAWCLGKMLGWTSGASAGAGAAGDSVFLRTGQIAALTSAMLLGGLILATTIYAASRRRAVALARP